MPEAESNLVPTVSLSCPENEVGLKDCPKNEQLAEKRSLEGNCEIFRGLFIL